jgi:arginine/lysine/histidine transporter system substrate-binding protein
MKKSMLLFLVSILAVGILAACGASEQPASSGGEAGDSGSDDEKVLIMGTSADYPPFEYIDTAKGDDIIGFDVDLANALAEKLGYKVQVEDIEFSGLVQALKSGQVDIVLAGMSPTEERKKNIDFTDIYYTARHMIVTKKDSGIEKLEDLKGKTVGVQLGSIQEGKANDIAEEIDIKVENRNRIPEIVQELMTGRFDAAIIEDTVATGYFESNEDLNGFVIEDEEELGSAIALPKDSELTDDFNKALQEMKDSGELEELVLKWFGGEE